MNILKGGFPAQYEPPNHKYPNGVLRVDFDEMIDFGPEQLIARIPIETIADSTRAVDIFVPLVGSLSDDLWQNIHTMSQE